MAQENQTQGITLSEGAISAIREIQDKEQCQIHLEGLEKLLQFVIHNNDSSPPTARNSFPTSLRSSTCRAICVRSADSLFEVFSLYLV